MSIISQGDVLKLLVLFNNQSKPIKIFSSLSYMTKRSIKSSHLRGLKQIKCVLFA